MPTGIVPALTADRAAGGAPTGAERVVAAWTLHLRGLGAPLNDAKADDVRPLGEGTLEESVAKVCDYLGLAARLQQHPHALLARMPLERVAYAHVAGGQVQHGVYLDTHAHPVPEPVLDLVGDLRERTGADGPPLLLERDEDVSVPTVAPELAALRARVHGVPVASGP